IIRLHLSVVSTFHFHVSTFLFHASTCLLPIPVVGCSHSLNGYMYLTLCYGENHCLLERCLTMWLCRARNESLRDSIGLIPVRNFLLQVPVGVANVASWSPIHSFS